MALGMRTGRAGALTDLGCLGGGCLGGGCLGCCYEEPRKKETQKPCWISARLG